MSNPSVPVALFLSPHLDDAAFSCAEPMLALHQAGWHVIVATIFTASVESPEGFALACQLDKGLAADVDYMALRRAEDRDCMTRLGASWRHLELREAPHRGYTDVASLFGPVRDDDSARQEVAAALQHLFDDCQPTVCMAPLAVGHHVDHRLVVDCLTERVAGAPVPRAGEMLTSDTSRLQYLDQPYALRNPDERDAAVRELSDVACLHFSTSDARRYRAISALEAYSTQVAFQFGSVSAMHQSLGATMAEGTRFWLHGEAADVLKDFPCNTSLV